MYDKLKEMKQLYLYEGLVKVALTSAIGTSDSELPSPADL
jgi:hypothetical protein